MRAPAAGWFDRACLAIVLLGLAVVLGPALAGRGALVDLNLLTGYSPWSTGGRALALACRSDTVDYYLPGIAAIKEGLFSGTWVTWSPYEVGGSPLASLPNHAALSPVSLPYYLMPLWLAPAYVKLAEVVVAVAGMVLFLRRLGVSRGPATVAGLVFVCSGFLVMWTNWPHTKVACFIPLLFWSLERFVQVRRTAAIVPVALVVASMLLGGFPAVTLFSLTFGGAYVLVRTCVADLGKGPRAARRRAGILLGSALGVLLGVGLSAVQLLPFVANLGALGLEERDARGAHLPGSLFITTVAPEAYGLCVGPRGFNPVSPVEGTGYLGAGALVLVACALLLPRRRTQTVPHAFFAAGAGVIVVLVWVGGPLLAAVQQLPFYASNSIARAQSVLAFAVAVLAGMGLDQLGRRLGEQRSRRAGHDRETASSHGTTSRRGHVARIMVAVSLAVGAAVAYALLTRTALAALDDPVDRAQVAGEVRLGAAWVAGAIGAVVLVLAGRARWSRPLGAVLVLLLTVVQGLSFAHAAWPLSDPENLYPQTSTHRFLAANLGGERFGGGERTMLPAVSDWYRLRTPTGHEFTDPRWMDLLLAVDPEVRLSPTYTTFSRSLDLPTMARSPVLDRLAVRYWTAAPTTAPGTVEALSSPAEATYPLGSTPASCSVPGGPLRGIGIRLPERRRPPAQGVVVVHVAVRAPTGTLVGSAQLARNRRVANIDVPVARGAGLPAASEVEVDVRVEGLAGPLEVLSRGEGPWCGAIRPAADGVALVHSDAGATLYERPSALPRIRWAGTGAVVPSPAERLRRLSVGVAPRTVLLEDPTLPAGSGRGARISTTRDVPGAVTARVSAEGSGYLVVADSVVRPGWEATVDGREVPLVRADHAFGAVAVPAGDHVVSLRYRAPGMHAGAVLSAASAALAVVITVVPAMLRRRRSARATAPTHG